MRRLSRRDRVILWASSAVLIYLWAAPSFAEDDKPAKFFLECIVVSDDDALCFEEAKAQLIEFVEGSLDKAVPTCSYTQRKVDIIQRGLSNQHLTIVQAAKEATVERKSGLSACLVDRARKLGKVESLLAERAGFTRTESRPNICRETSAFLSMLGLHAQLLAKQARECYDAKMPTSSKPKL